MIAKTEAVVKSKAPAYLPLIRRIPLNLSEPEIGKRTCTRFLVISKITYQRVGISIARVTKRVGVVIVITGKVEHTGPLSTGRLTILQTLIVHTKLKGVVSMRD